MHLLLAGHTHRAFPPLGSWPARTADSRHGPLAAGSCQVVSGTVSQMRTGRLRELRGSSTQAKRVSAAYPYQFSWLRIYKHRSAPRRLSVERMLPVRGRAVLAGAVGG